MSAVEERLASMTEEEKDEALRHVARRIPEPKRGYFLETLKEGQEKVSYKKELEDFHHFVQQVEEGIIYYTCGQEDTDDADHWDHEYEVVYMDEHGISEKVSAGFKLAENLLFQRSYKEALSLYNRLYSLTFQAVDEEGGETYEFNIKGLLDEDLLKLPHRRILILRMYAIYQALESESRMKELLALFTQTECLDIRLSEIFTVGPEALKGVEDFLEDWMVFLKDAPGHRAGELLCQSAQYAGGADGLMAASESAGEKHPLIYLKGCEALLEERRYEDCEALGLKALAAFPRNLVIRAEICDLLSQAEMILQHEDVRTGCLLEAFYADSTPLRFLRVHGLVEGHKSMQKAFSHLQELPLRESWNPRGKAEEFEINRISLQEKAVMELFSGDYEKTVRLCLIDTEALGWSDSIKGIMIPLFILSMNMEESLTGSGEKLLQEIMQKKGIPHKDHDAFREEYLRWRRMNSVPQEVYEQYIDFLDKEVGKRTEAVVGGGYRHSYHKAALLIENYGELLESRGLANGRDMTVSYYQKRYPRKSAFRQAFST